MGKHLDHLRSSHKGGSSMQHGGAVHEGIKSNKRPAKTGPGHGASAKHAPTAVIDPKNIDLSEPASQG